jgi:hypothetical protein
LCARSAEQVRHDGHGEEQRPQQRERQRGECEVDGDAARPAPRGADADVPRKRRRGDAQEDAQDGPCADVEREGALRVAVVGAAGPVDDDAHDGRHRRREHRQPLQQPP